MHVDSSSEEEFLGFESEEEGASDTEFDGLVDYSTDRTDDSDEDEPPNPSYIAKDGTVWSAKPSLQRKVMSRNLLREQGGPHRSTRYLDEKESFKCLLNQSIYDTVLKMTNKKIEAHLSSKRATSDNTTIQLVTEDELDAFLGLLIYAGVHQSNNEEISELWGLHSLPLFKATMAKNRFQEILRFIRFDDSATRPERLKVDKAAAISEVFGLLNKALQSMFKPYECLTVDEQLYAYRGRLKFKQYIPSKPAKYGIKVFWLNDVRTAYPLQGILYKGKEADAERKTNVGANIVLDLAKPYRKSGRNITADNFFIDLFLAQTLTKWNLTLVGTVRKSKRFLPPIMLASKEKKACTSNFGFLDGVMVCSYVPKKNRAVILLSTMHSDPVVDQTEAKKPEVVLYYNSTKGGTDTMDAMLARYSSKRKTNRWSLCFFFNILDLAGLAAYIIYKENNPCVTDIDTRRRSFLKTLAFQLCMPSIEKRREHSKIYGSPLVKVAIDYFIPPTTLLQSAISTKSIEKKISEVVGSCRICQNLQLKRRKTRRACGNCSIPVCAEHSTLEAICTNCYNSKSK